MSMEKKVVEKSQAEVFWQNPPKLLDLMRLSPRRRKMIASQHEEIADQAEVVCDPKRRVDHLIVPHSHEEQENFPEDYLDGYARTIFAQGIVIEGVQIESNWRRVVEKGQSYTPDEKRSSLTQRYLNKLLRGGVQVSGIDIVLNNHSSLLKPGHDEGRIQDVVEVDFRNLIWATKLASMSRPHLITVGAVHFSRNPLSIWQEDNDRAYHDNPDFNTLVEYIKDPELRLKRWGEYLEKPDLFKAITNHVALEPSMWISHIIGEETEETKGGNKELRIRIKKDRSMVDDSSVPKAERELILAILKKAAA